MIDTHAHLNFKEYQENLDKIISRAKENGVAKIICVSSNLAESKKSIEIARQYPGVIYAAVGIHPHQTDPENRIPLKKQIKALGELAKQKEVVAVGECGLDYSPAPIEEKDRSQKEQFFLFRKQVAIAQQLNLPLIIHSRETFDDTVDILAEQKVRGVFHCYSAGKKGVAKVNQLGFYFGVDGNITYDVGLQNVFAGIPLKKILLETDAPFLAPAPHRGEQNEPAFLVYIAKKLAEIHHVSFKEVDSATTKNARSLLDLIDGNSL